MALGDPIGYAARVSMNNSSTYDFNNSQRGVHMALMGDPTLRADVVTPPGSLVADYENGLGLLSWSESPEATEGYLIYRKGPYDTGFSRISGEPVQTTSYTDSCFSDEGVFTYMVRALHLEESNAGSYFNLSTGVCDTLLNPELPFALVPGFTYNMENGTVSFQNTSVGAEHYSWDFGDGSTSSEANPVHVYSEPGEYSVTLTAWNDCLEDSVSFDIEITLSMEAHSNANWRVYPNPTKGIITLDAPPALGPVLIYNAMGKLVAQFSDLSFDMGLLPKGMYTIQYAGSKFKVILI
jgi:hypothetical protein